MSAVPAAMANAAERTPPKKTGETGGGVITATATSAAAAELDVLGATFAGGAYYSFQSVGGDTHIWFKAATSAASITTGNGVKLLDGGAPQEFYLTLSTRYLEHIASAVGTLRWWRSSPNERDRA